VLIHWPRVLLLLTWGCLLTALRKLLFHIIVKYLMLESRCLSPNQEKGRKDSASGLLPEPRLFDTRRGFLHLAIPLEFLWSRRSHWVFYSRASPLSSFPSCCPPALLLSPSSRWLGLVEQQNKIVLFFFMSTSKLPAASKQRFVKPWAIFF